MRIIGYINDKPSGVNYHRIIMPLMLMRDIDTYVTNTLRSGDFEKGCDVLVYSRDHAPANLAELKERYGFKVCVDVDDYWELDEHHILYQHYKEVEFAKKQIKHLMDADLVLTTHSRLAEEVAVYNKNVHVCPNAIPRQGQFDIEREPYYLTRLFWQGSDTHRADINLLKTPIDKLGPIAGKIKMVMGGYAEDHEDWYHMVHDYTAGLKHQYKLIPYAPITSYYEAYKEADICLIPLLNSKFNRHKSNLKILEAANLGLPVIASAVHPYLDLPVFYAKHSGDWVKYIKRLVESRKRQKEAGQKLAEYCAEHYNFNKINNMRKQVLEYEAKKERV
jgi:glycosyltransferase involved in cell wall biosynthesis